VIHHAAVTETVLHSFGRHSDGVEPFAGLTYVNGTFYGTTFQGGGRGCSDKVGCGIVFSMTRSGKETVLHDFAGGQDGEFPGADLINVNGTLYGTTGYGGPINAGTVFSITPSGTKTLLHGFTGSPDGALPGALLNVNGTIYGTTYRGGTGPNGGGGTVFTITPSGNETVIYNFRSYSRHGDGPGNGPLLKLKRKLYGTTNGGGAYDLGGVFSQNMSDHQKLLYSFQGGDTDGASPSQGLVNVNGTLYGTTTSGGTSNDGTVFSITPSGSETILHSFTDDPDGSQPLRSLLNVNGTMYGTTLEGGTYGNGTVFSITPSGTETVLYSFMGQPDGEFPLSDLIYVKGRLYGTTESGGAAYEGTVFAITL
jgi:uncharacterized repeat protein (TIGR03803 family)